MRLLAVPLLNNLTLISVDSAAPQEIFGGCITQHVPHPPATPKFLWERLREYGRVFGANWGHLKFPFGVSELP